MKHALDDKVVDVVVNGRATRALVEHVIHKRSGLLHVRLRLTDLNVWVRLGDLQGDDQRQWYVGKRTTVPLTALLHVRVEDEWVDAADFLEWAEGDKVKSPEPTAD